MTPNLEFTDEFYGRMTWRSEIYADESEWFYWQADIGFVPGERFLLEIHVPSPDAPEAVFRTRPTFQAIVAKIENIRKRLTDKIAEISGAKSAPAQMNQKIRVLSIFEDLSATIEFTDDRETNPSANLYVLLDRDLQVVGAGFDDE